MNNKMNVAYSYSWQLSFRNMEQVQGIIESLRQCAIKLGSESVSNVIVLTGNQVQPSQPDADHVIMFTASIVNARSDSGPHSFGLGFSPNEKSWTWRGVVRVSSFKEISGLMIHAASLDISVRTTFAGMEMEYKKNAVGEIEVEQRALTDWTDF